MKIEHVALYLHDLEAGKEFFIKYFDGKSNEIYHNKKTDFRSYFISFDNGSRLEIMNRPELANAPESQPCAGFAHIAFSVGSEEKVIALTERLKSDGYEVVGGPRVTGDGYFESCIAALEGNLIEITV